VFDCSVLPVGGGVYDGLAAPHVLHLDDGAHTVHVVDEHELAPRIFFSLFSHGLLYGHKKLRGRTVRKDSH
jgi:hypothetical protein